MILEHAVCYMQHVVCSWNTNTPITGIHLDGFLNQNFDRIFNTLLSSEFDIAPDSHISHVRKLISKPKSQCLP